MYTKQDHDHKKLVDHEFHEYVGKIKPIPESTKKIFMESADNNKPKKLLVKMEATHVGLNKNFRYYTEQGLKAGLKSWTLPYNKPVLTNHDEYNGTPIGRIVDAKYETKTLSGKPGLVFTCMITDQDAIEKILDGRYQTVSIGCMTDKVTCSICGADRTKEWCEHWPGETYDDQVCHFIIGKTDGIEVSYVNVPADENAGNISVSEENDDGQSTASTQEKSISQKESDKSPVLTDMYLLADSTYKALKKPEVNLYQTLPNNIKKMVDSLAKGSEAKMGEPTETKDVSAELKTVQDALAVSQKENTNLKKKVAEMQKTITDMVLDKTKAETQIKELKDDVEKLTQEKAGLISENHKTLAEQVVDLKYQLKKADVVGIDKKEALEEHIGRTKESLEDSLKDLQTELKNNRPEPGSVQNPGIQEPENGETKKFTVGQAVDFISNMFEHKK
jgi:hypothetical protein